MVDFSNLAVILSSFALGWGLKRLKIMPRDAATVLNRFIIYVSLPAITLNLVHQLLQSQTLGRQSLLPITMPWLFFALAALVFGLIGRKLKWSRPTIGALTLTAGLGNTSFVGFPLIETFYGKEGLATGVLVDQPGSFLVLGTLGIITATLYAGRDVSLQRVLKQVFLFPPMIAGMTAVLLMPVSFHHSVTEVLEKLGACLVPLALFSVGLQFELDPNHLKSERRFLTLGLFYKLFLGPIFMMMVYYLALGARGKTLEITLFESAMAPMISAGIVATEFDLNPKLSALMVGFGTALSLLTTPLWWWILSRV